MNHTSPNKVDVPYDDENVWSNRVNFNLGDKGSVVYEKQADGTMTQTHIPKPKKPSLAQKLLIFVGLR